jgi:hypothetical protein
MSGRIYDQSGKATCEKCGSDCWLSNERNFNGAKCKNIKCGNTSLESIVYDTSVAYQGTFAYFINELGQPLKNCEDEDNS